MVPVHSHSSLTLMASTIYISGLFTTSLTVFTSRRVVRLDLLDHKISFCRRTFLWPLATDTSKTTITHPAPPSSTARNLTDKTLTLTYQRYHGNKVASHSYSTFKNVVTTNPWLDILNTPLTLCKIINRQILSHQLVSTGYPFSIGLEMLFSVTLKKSFLWF
jgi:hypothetical protein